MSAQPQFWGWSTSPLTVAFWGWEESVSIPNIISGIPHVIRQAERWLVVHFIPSYKAVKDSFTPQVVTYSMISTVSQLSNIYKTVYGTGSFKAIQDAYIPRVQNVQTTGKVSRDTPVCAVNTQSSLPKVCAAGNVAKVGR